MVAGTFLEGAPIIHTAAGEQPQGIEELKEAIDQLPNATMTETGPFRLPIDRAFTQKGFGVVVTGTSRDGSVSVGDNLMVMPEGIATKARSIQVHGEPTNSAGPNLRVAINLQGAELSQLYRGQTLIIEQQLPLTSIIDCRFSAISETEKLSTDQRIRLLSNSLELLAKAVVIDERTDSTEQLIQLRLERPAVLCAGDRFIIRKNHHSSRLGEVKSSTLLLQSSEKSISPALHHCCVQRWREQLGVVESPRRTGAQHPTGFFAGR